MPHYLNIRMVSLFFLFSILMLFAYFYVVELATYDLFSFSTWGLIFEIIKNGHLLMKPYSSAGVEWRWADHPNTYSKLFYPHIFGAIFYTISELPIESLSLMMSLVYLLVFYTLLKNFLQGITGRDIPQYIELTLINIYILIMFIRNIHYPGYSFYYISYGMLMFFYWLLVLTLGDKSKYYHNIHLFMIIMFIVSSNFSYYTSGLIIILVSLSSYLFLKLPYFKILHDNWLRKRYIFWTSFIIASLLLFALNPIIEALYGKGNKDIIGMILDSIKAILTISLIGGKSAEQVISMTHITSLLSQISSLVLKTTTIALSLVFVALLILKILRPEVLPRSLNGVSLAISSGLVSPVIAVIYNIFSQPVVHTYMLVFSSIIGSYFATCISFKMELKHRLLSISIRVVTITLTFLLLISSVTLFINSHIINIDTIYPRNFHKDAQNLVNYIVTYVSTENDVAIVSYNAFSAQLYFKSVFNNITTGFKYYPFDDSPNNIAKNCRGGNTCFYALQYPYGIYNTIFVTHSIVNKSLGLVFKDGKFILVYVRRSYG